ncbi:TMhelix containing protein [Vibrio phage 120E34-1]|nr:TMhelix containing protein [Vibrio phage 120E34-1]
MHTYTKQEQSKWINYQPQKQPNRLREAINATVCTLAVIIVCSVVTLVFWSF